MAMGYEMKISEHSKETDLRSLTSSRKADSSSGKQRASFAIEGKVDGEQNITPIVIEVDR